MNGYPINDDAAPRSRYRLWLRCPTGADDSTWGLPFAAFTFTRDGANYEVFNFGGEYVAWDSEEFSRSLAPCRGSERVHPQDYGRDNEGFAGWGATSPADECLVEEIVQ